MGYTEFAKYYDLYWTKDAPALFEKVLNRIVLPSLPENAEILDICCGTGQLCERLSRRFYRLTGIDNSQRMLDFAAQNAPNAVFSLQNAENFSLPQEFSAVVSFFDSVNHFLSEEAVLNLFNSVRKALAPDGVFCFDINGITAFDDGWDEGFSMVDSKSACIVKPLFDPVSGSIVYNITIFEGCGGSYKRIDTAVKERYYSDDKILLLLRNSGFNEVQILDGCEDLMIKSFRGRHFFLARANSV
ncbi:MAG: class I SAM-dependent methyltransferase [Deferribacteraceae bacterium]|nr:class I SAM-dependent methyltransferase [Deferribacteraceae bacterium]